jgi:hypothetical protein
MTEYSEDNPYRPSSAKRRELIDRAWEHVRSVPYKVSLRWVFYRLLQDGLVKGKSSYTLVQDTLGDARKGYYKDWRPDTLADESRSPIVRTGLYDTPTAWFKKLKEQGLHMFCDAQAGAEQRVFVAFEAAAMASQFGQHTQHVDLYPFGGFPSITYKWELAEAIAYSDEPVVVLYFGDADTTGGHIGSNAEADISRWVDELTGADCEWVHVGLTVKQARQYKLPEAPDKLGVFQWEALSDSQAGELIGGAMKEYLDHETVAHNLAQAGRAELKVKRWLAKMP